MTLVEAMSYYDFFTSYFDAVYRSVILLLVEGSSSYRLFHVIVNDSMTFIGVILPPDLLLQFAQWHTRPDLGPDRAVFTGTCDKCALVFMRNDAITNRFHLHVAAKTATAYNVLRIHEIRPCLILI